MIRSQLNSYNGSDPIWGFVALLANERFTGEAAVGLDPRVRLFAVEGRVYFAEREGDAPVSTRLVNCGAVTTTQLEHGAVRIGDTTSLARLFQREPGIDRDAVELTIETATEALLESIANKPVGMPEVFPLRHHSSGIHHWLRSAHPTAPPANVSPSVAVPVVADEVAGPEMPPKDVAPVELAPFEAAPFAIAPVETEPMEAIAVAVPVQPDTVDFVPTEVLTVAEVFVDSVETPTPVLHEWLLMPLAPQPQFEAAAEPVIGEPEISETEIGEPEMAEPEAAEEPGALPVLEPAPHAETNGQSWGDSFSSHTPPRQPAPFTEAAPLLEEPAAFDEPAPAPHTNGFSMLPTLGSLSSYTATEPVVEAAAEPVVEAAAEPTIELATMPALATTPTMPTLGSLTSLTSPTLQQHETIPAAGVSDPDFFGMLDSQASQGSEPAPTYTDFSTHKPGLVPADLPKLAAAPISMEDLLAIDAANSGNAAASWGGATHNLAAVEIWEMIDGLDGPAPSDNQLVASGTEKRSRGWLRGRKG